MSVEHRSPAVKLLYEMNTTLIEIKAHIEHEKLRTTAAVNAAISEHVKNCQQSLGKPNRRTLAILGGLLTGGGVTIGLLIDWAKSLMVP